MLNPKEEAALQLISENSAYENYFFNKVSNLKWFYPLKEKGYFSPGKAPSPKASEQEGYFTIPHWNILDYLEKVSKQVTIKENEKYTEELLEIISNVTKYHVEHNRILDNYRTWWFFAKILLNVPNDKTIKYLREHEIDMAGNWIKEWITSKFDNTLPASEIGNRLLPKFLTEQECDIEIAEKIVETITAIKWEQLTEENKELYGRKAEPKTIVKPFWLLESFKKNARKIGDLCSENVIYNLASKLKEIFAKEHEDYQVVVDLNTNKYRLTTKRIKNFNFEILVELLSKEELDALKPEDQYFGVVSVKGIELHRSFLRNCRDKNSFIKGVKEKLKLIKEISPIVKDKEPEIDKKLSNQYQELHSDYSFIWFRSIASGPDVGIHKANEVLTVILRDILLSKCKSDPKIGRTILDKFLGEEYQFPLFRRLVLFVVSNSWNEYKHLFWKFLDDNPEVFNESDYEVELHKLLQSNVDKFTRGEKEKIETVISKGPRYLPENNQEKYTAYWKQKGYSPMQKDPYFAKLFEEQKAISKVEEIAPPREKGVLTEWGEGPSPLTKNEVLAISTPEIAKYLNEFKQKDTWKGPTVGGLAEILRAAAKEKPEKFVNSLTPFLGVSYLYVYNILFGLQDAWKEKESFNWGKLFCFAEKYINRPTFWKGERMTSGDDWSVTHTWVTSAVANLIQEGTRNDSWAFPEDYLDQAEEILYMIIEKLPVKGEEEKISQDAVTHAMNTPFGKVIIAMILLSLRRTQLGKKKGFGKEVRWNPRKYEALLKKRVIEAFTFFGQYMPNFAYLNRPWVVNKIKEFESFPNEDLGWRSFMQGYLLCHKLYIDLYDLMRTHYSKGIDADFKEPYVGERLVQHIAIGYLGERESLDEKVSLFKKIIEKWRYPQLKEIVSYFWSESEVLLREAKEAKESEENRKVKNRIMKFWQWTYEQRNMIKDKLKKDYGNLLSDLSRLTRILDKIDSENSKWLLLSAPFVDRDFNSSFFIEYLNRFEKKESIEFIGKIFLKMLSTITPNFDQVHIVSIVKKLYRFGYKADADEICNIYGSKGYQFLRPIYEESNKL